MVPGAIVAISKEVSFVGSGSFTGVGSFAVDLWGLGGSLSFSTGVTVLAIVSFIVASDFPGVSTMVVSGVGLLVSSLVLFASGLSAEVALGELTDLFELGSDLTVLESDMASQGDLLVGVEGVAPVLFLPGPWL